MGGAELFQELMAPGDIAGAETQLAQGRRQQLLRLNVWPHFPQIGFGTLEQLR
jgi:hypothetical protein